MTIWARVDSDMPTDGKLLGQPVVTRHLWTCLICLARKQDEHGVIRGYDCSLLAGAFNLPRRAIATALTHFQAARMIEVEADGTICLINFRKWNGDKSLADLRAEWRQRQDRTRGVTRQPSRVTNPNVTRDGCNVSHATEVEVEVEEEEKEDPPPSPKSPATPAPSIADLESDWPQALLSRVKLAVMSTRKSGQMADGPWREFLMGAKQFSVEIRVRAANEYLDRACAADGKSERYLLGIMRGERTRIGTQRPGGAALQITPDAKADHAVPGRKFL